MGPPTDKKEVFIASFFYALKVVESQINRTNHSERLSLAFSSSCMFLLKLSKEDAYGLVISQKAKLNPIINKLIQRKAVIIFS